MVNHLYFHIPFCHQICPYCNFYKHKPSAATSPSALVDALLVELKLRHGQRPLSPKTIYVGGGTPSMLSTRIWERFLNQLGEVIDLGALEEMTIEANPATFDLAKAKTLVSGGVTRVSLGVQSWHLDELEMLGRDHDANKAAEAYAILREAEVPQINIDLMFSLPNQPMAKWQETVERTCSLQPDHISAYNLTYEEDTPFFESLEKGEFKPSEERDASHFLWASDYLHTHGFEHYEISNYAQAGNRSLHNQAYWAGNDYLGLGPSAVTTIERKRSRNVPDTEAYVTLINKGYPSVAEADSEVLDDEAWRIERLALGLRTKAGVNTVYLGDADCDPLLNEKLAEWVDDRLVLTPKGWPLVDEVAAFLA